MPDKKLIDQLNNDANTVALVQETGLPGQVAMRWIKAHAPKALADGRVWTHLYLLHLQADLQVCAVFLDPEQPTMDFERQVDRVLRGYPKPDAELFEHIRITPPIKTVWERPNKYAPAVPNTSVFIDQLSATLAPLRLDYIDRGEPKPSIMKLATL